MAGLIRLLAAAEADDMDEPSGRRQRETGKRSRAMTHEEDDDEDLDDIDTLAFQNEMMSSSSRVRGNVSMSEMFTRIASKLEETTTKKLDEEDDDDDAPLNLSSSSDDEDEEGAVSVINPIHIGTKTMRGIVQVPEITAEDREYPLREDGYPRPSRKKARGEGQEEGQEGDGVQGAQEGRRGPEYVAQYKEAREKLNSNPYYKFLTLVAGASNVPVTRIVNQNKALEKLIEESSIRNRQRVSLAKRLSQIDTLKKRIQETEARAESAKEMRGQLDNLEDTRADLDRLLKTYDMRDSQATKNNLLLRRSIDSLVLIEYASSQGRITADSFAEAAEYYQMQREGMMAGGLPPPPPLARGRRRGRQSASTVVVKEEEDEGEGELMGDEGGNEAPRQLVTIFKRALDNMMSVNSRLRAPDWVPNSVLVNYMDHEGGKIAISLTLGLQFLLYESNSLILDPLASIKTQYERLFIDDNVQAPINLVDSPATNKRNVIALTVTSMRHGLVNSWVRRRIGQQQRRGGAEEEEGSEINLESESEEEEGEEEAPEQTIDEITENIKVHVMQQPALHRLRRMMPDAAGPPRTPAAVTPPSGPSTPMGEYNNDTVALILNDLGIDNGRLYTIVYNALMASLRVVERIAREDTDHNKAARQDAAAQIIQLISRNILTFDISESMGTELLRLGLNNMVASETLADVVRESLDLPQDIHPQVIGIIGFARKWIREFVNTRKAAEAQLKEQEDLFEKLSKEMDESEKVDMPSLEYAPSIEWALEPMNSGFFEVEAIVQYGIQAAFSLVKRLLPQFADVEDPEVLQESPDAAVPFANIVAGEMVKSAALSPVRWLPATTTRNADMKIGQALKTLSQMFYDKYARVVRTKRFGDITTW